MLLFTFGLLWLFAWGALIYTLKISYSGSSHAEHAGMNSSSESNWSPSSEELYSLPRGPKELTPVAGRPAGSDRSEPDRPKFYAACSGAGTIRTFETSAELLCFIAGRSLSSWAVFKRRPARWWAVWRRVDLEGQMSTSEIEGAIWET